MTISISLTNRVQNSYRCSSCTWTVPLFVTSRIRPSWVSESLLYGEVAEFGRNILAMTHEEAARAVPPKTDPSLLAGLVALAEGWPAVIGLRH